MSTLKQNGRQKSQEDTVVALEDMSEIFKPQKLNTLFLVLR